MKRTAGADFWFRRIHMYAALFLVPWVLMYAISTLSMNHRKHLGGSEPGPVFETILEREVRDDLLEGATPQRIAERLAGEFDMPGRRRVSEDPETGTVVVTGESPFGMRRITYRTASGLVTVDSARYGVRRFLSQLHYRIGYEWRSPWERAWGFSVDLFALTMLFWIVSGLWMWWTIRSTRRPGLLSLGVGIGLLALFLAAL